MDPSTATPFPIVGIGASAGGLEALEELLAAMPGDTDMGFVIVTHQHPDHPSLLPGLLQKVTAMKVVVAEDGMKVAKNHVYVTSPGGQLAILNGSLHRIESEHRESPHLPIDYFLRSLAEDQKDKAICIILSGSGTDGTLGLRAIKEKFGMVMVQDVHSAKYGGMPGSAIATGLADYVLPPAEMPLRLVSYAKGPHLTSPFDETSAALPEPIHKIFLMLRTRTGHDFSNYKPNTIRRRIERRINLHHLKDLVEYVRFLEDNPHELDILFKELLISVTNFFRDPEAFDVLAADALTPLLKTCATDYGFRIWVPGCATGEEVYSLAIMMREAIDAAKLQCDVQVFGTDLDHQAIEVARNGIYPEGISSDISALRLERWFIHEESRYRIRKEIRETAAFAIQNVIKDPPFTKLDIISCRNLLIYLNSSLQRRLIALFHYSLKPGGLLFLGSSEGIANFNDLFEVVDKKWKIFRRRETETAHSLIAFSTQPVTTTEFRLPPLASTPHAPPNLVTALERLLLVRFAPASVLVTDRGQVVYIFGRTGFWLEPAAGHPQMNILEMAREGLQLHLASALRQALIQNTEVTRERVRVRTTATDFSYVDIGVMKLKEPDSLRDLLLVTFRESPVIDEKTSNGRSHARDNEDSHEELTRELAATRESLHSAIKELEIANEEFKSTNEELQSTNEELQSSNEELETSKEEMQSLNEELTTVNAEMESRWEDLSRTHDDMSNVLNSTAVAAILLDRDLNIKRFTEHARELISLIPTDIGRPLAHLVSNLAYDRLVEDCREVLRTLVFKVAEVRTKTGLWYLLRIMPYRTAQNLIDGVVVTFVDINPVKTAEKCLLRMSKVFLDGPEPMMILDVQGRISQLNDEAERSYGWSRTEMHGQPFHMIVAESSKQDMEAAFGKCLADATVRNAAFVGVTKVGREIPGMITFKLLTDEFGAPEAVTILTKHPASPES